jgi:hypothetical protein
MSLYGPEPIVGDAAEAVRGVEKRHYYVDVEQSLSTLSVVRTNHHAPRTKNLRPFLRQGRCPHTPMQPAVDRHAHPGAKCGHLDHE